MIKMIRGAYGLKINGVVEAMTSRSAPFSLTDAREAELVAAGVAVYVQEPDENPAYNKMKMAELREAAAAYGVDASKIRSKKRSNRHDRGRKGESRQRAGGLTRDLQRADPAGSRHGIPQSG